MQKYVKKVNLPLIFNKPYRPQYMGQEHIWSIAKHKFRKAMMECKLEMKVENTEKIVADVQKEI